MAKFSKTFGLDLSQPELDFVDIDLDKDIPLFIDPYALSIKSDIFSTKCNEYVSSYFQTVIDCIKKQEDSRAKHLLNNLGEPNETCLGVSKGSPSGRGISTKNL